MAIEPSGWIGGLILNLTANIIFPVVLWAWRKWRSLLERRTARVRNSLLGGIWALYALINAVSHAFQQQNWLWVFIPTTLFMAYFTWSELRAFWLIGFVGADRSIREGIGFERSLGLCRNSLDFLGIGANKLVQTGQVLDAAAQRCNRPDHPVRFLLCKPDSVELETIARQFGKDRAAYQAIVQASLAYLQRLKSERAFNVEIRLYD